MEFVTATQVARVGWARLDIMFFIRNGHSSLKITTRKTVNQLINNT